MKKRSKIAKVLALCLAMVMMLSMSITSFALDLATDKGSITVNGLSSDNDATVTAYKVIDINFDATNQQPVEPVYTWTDEMAAWFADAGAQYDAYIDTTNENAVTKNYTELSVTGLKTFYDAVKGAGLTEAATGTIVNDTCTLSGLSAGEYLVIAEKAGGTYQPMTAKVDVKYNKDTSEWEIENAEINLKGSAPTIEKEATTGTDVKIGDVVDYKLTVDIPVYPDNATATRFVISDTLSDGLTLDVDSITICIGNETTTLEDTYYNLNTDTANSFTFDLAAHYKEIRAAYPDAEKIYVKYSATVNADAFEEDELGNDAFVGYTNDPYSDSNSKTDVDETVYTYAIDVTKYAKGTENTLAGATFQLSKDNTVLALVEVTDGVYRPAVNNTEETVQDLVVSTEGKLTIKGIDLGEYTLKETVAPDGYVLPDGEITITLVDEDGVNNEPNGTLDAASSATGTTVRESSVSVEGTKTLALGVDNTNYEDAGFQLPTTGGMGTMIFTIAGILIMAGAITMVVVISRKKRA